MRDTKSGRGKTIMIIAAVIVVLSLGLVATMDIKPKTEVVVKPIQHEALQ